MQDFKLKTPIDLKIDNTTLTWGAVEGASGYTLTIDAYDKNADAQTVTLTKETREASYDLAELTEQKAYDIRVSAVCGNEELNSRPSEIIEYVTLPETKGLVYDLEDGKLSYTLIGTGEVADAVIVIPSAHNLLPVTCIVDSKNYASGVFHAKVKKIIIPKTVKSLGDYAFAYCTDLTGVKIPDSVKSIESYAFYKCAALKWVKIPDKITSIAGNAFGICTGLTSITIPAGVTEIGYGTFYYCQGLTSATVLSETPPTLGGPFVGVPDDIQIFVPAASVEAYKAAEGWVDYASRIKAIE